jgi:hypothetical protein
MRRAMTSSEYLYSWLALWHLACDAASQSIQALNKGESRMNGAGFYTPIKIVGYLILLLMLIAIGYAAYITLKYWAGIGV